MVLVNELDIIPPHEHDSRICAACNLMWIDGYDSANKIEERLWRALRNIRDFGYQPMYNGRPSCPFCNNFVDEEETHRKGCVLVAALLYLKIGGI